MQATVQWQHNVDFPCGNLLTLVCRRRDQHQRVFASRMVEQQPLAQSVIARVEAVPPKRNAWQHKYTLAKWVLPYMIVLTIFMTTQVLIFPSSLRVAFWPDSKHAEIMRKETMKHDIPIPYPAALKYIGHLTFVWLHHMASLPWLFLMPLQMSTKLRAAMPALHHALGGMAVVSAAVATIGIVYWDVTGMSVFNERTDTCWALRASAVWFAYTIMRGIQAAKQRKYSEHRTWMLRHMGAGAWIIVTRMIVMGMIFASKAGVIVPYEARTEEERKDEFFALNYIGFTVSVLIAEAAAWHSGKQQATKQA